MSIRHKAFQESQREIDLEGPDGNAFALMAIFKNTAKQLDYNDDEIKKFIDQMMSGDYTNLVKIFNDHLGSYFTLYTTDRHLLRALESQDDIPEEEL
mgnify:FL=1|tara:strand:- start:638 stop:928 length:291 start_codon:yes stop_codon:yes gene_type:complete